MNMKNSFLKVTISLFVWLEIWVYSEHKIKSGEQTTSKKRNWINKTSLTKAHSLNKWLINLRNGKNVFQFCRTQKSSSSREFMGFFLENYGEKIFPIPYWQFPAWFTWMQYFYLINHFMMVFNQMKKKRIKKIEKKKKNCQWLKSNR